MKQCLGQIRRSLPILVVSLLLAVLPCFPTALAQTKKPISKEGLLGALRLKGLSIDELVHEIETRGVAFQMTEQDEKELRRAGATPTLISAIKYNYKDIPPTARVEEPKSKETVPNGLTAPAGSGALQPAPGNESVKEAPPKEQPMPANVTFSKPDPNAPVYSVASVGDDRRVIDALNHYVRAVGGKDAILKINSRSLKGEISVSTGKHGTIEKEWEWPDKYHIIVKVAGLTFEEGYDGKTGWRRNGKQLEALSENGLAELQREAVLRRELDFRRIYNFGLVSSGTTELNGRSVLIVEASGKNAVPERLYFDQDTGLLMRKDSVENSGLVLGPRGMNLLTYNLYYDDYRTVDNVMVPFAMKWVSDYFSYTITVTELKQNVPIDASKFEFPHKH